MTEDLIVELSRKVALDGYEPTQEELDMAMNALRERRTEVAASKGKTAKPVVNLDSALNDLLGNKK